MKTPIHFIGNAHVDPTWMWRLHEGMEAFLATCRSALDRMDETPDFIFTASSAAHYEFVEQTDPLLFARIQEAVKNNRWEIIGGWWVEADCHIPSGESFLRQALYGQRYFYEKFGKICKTGYCIDSFGHNANLPQLLRQCGMENYVFMRPDESDLTLPAPLFKWRSLSGDEVIAYQLPLHYSNFEHSVTEKIELLQAKEFYDPSHSWMLFYGVGNHGGGPTKEQIAEIIKNTMEGADLDIKFSSVESFFDSLDKNNLPIYEGEMQPHAVGCYSAHSEIKRLNRKAENELLRAEKFCVLSEMGTGNKIDWNIFLQAWKNILLNQFHDTLGGVSVKEACDDAITMYHESLAIARRQEQHALQTLSNNIDTIGNIETLIVFNPHTFALSQAVEFELWHPQSSERGEHIGAIELIDSEGNNYQAQLIESSGKIGGDRVRGLFIADLPAFGWRSFRIERKLEKLEEDSQLVCNQSILSNGKVGICFDDTITKENHIKYISAAVFRDESDTWGHGIDAFDDQIGEFKITNIQVIEHGPLRARVRVRSAFNLSSLVEDFIVQRDSDEIGIQSYLNFQEKNVVLKTRFLHNLSGHEVISEIPYSVISRKPSSKEYPFGSWLFAQNENEGIGILSDSKSSYSCDDKYIPITCARSPLIAHHAPPHVIQSTQTLRYHDQGEQEFSFRLILGQKNWQEAEMPKRSLCFLQPAVAHIESGHTGELPLISDAGLICSAPNILITFIKQAEDGSGYILRTIEYLGMATDVSFELKSQNLSWKATFSAYEIKTFRIGNKGVTETDALERLL